jgi:hypothetical protein
MSGEPWGGIRSSLVPGSTATSQISTCCTCICTWMPNYPSTYIYAKATRYNRLREISNQTISAWQAWSTYNLISTWRQERKHKLAERSWLLTRTYLHLTRRNCLWHRLDETKHSRSNSICNNCARKFILHVAKWCFWPMAKRWIQVKHKEILRLREQQSVAWISDWCITVKLWSCMKPICCAI